MSTCRSPKRRPEAPMRDPVRTVSLREHPPLRGRSKGRGLWPDSQKADTIAKLLPYVSRPLLKLLTGPFEPVIVMSELTGRQCFKRKVVFYVRGRDRYSRRPGKFE